jgi:citrate synthase
MKRESQQSKSKVLFEVTEENLETGMRGYPAGYCTTSSVDPQKGLMYAGRPLAEVYNWAPEEVIHLIYHGKEGSFASTLQERAGLSPKTIAGIRTLPREGHPMKLFSMALLLLGIHEGTRDYREDCLNVIAKIPHLVAEVINHHAGWGETSPSKPDLGYMENFTQMVRVPDGNYQTLGRIFRLFNVLHYDHGGGNLSAFTGKAIASGLEDMYGSLSGAMCALAGPRHGRANQDCLEFVQSVLDKLGPDATTEQVENLIRDLLTNKQLVFGFGHAVLRVEDPRATIWYNVAEEMFPDHPLVKIGLRLREAGPKVLKENPKIANPYPNVDAMSGSVLSAAGFAHPDYYTLLFGLARCVGISIQIVYERLEARDGKGTPIIRPKYLYKAKSDTIGW